MTIEAIHEGHHGPERSHESAESAPRDEMCPKKGFSSRLKIPKKLRWFFGMKEKEVRRNLLHVGQSSISRYIYIFFGVGLDWHF